MRTAKVARLRWDFATLKSHPSDLADARASPGRKRGSGNELARRQRTPPRSRIHFGGAAGGQGGAAQHPPALFTPNADRPVDSAQVERTFAVSETPEQASPTGLFGRLEREVVRDAPVDRLRIEAATDAVGGGEGDGAVGGREAMAVAAPGAIARVDASVDGRGLDVAGGVFNADAPVRG